MAPMGDGAHHIERRFQATLTASERLQAQRDAWQVLQMLQLQPNTRDPQPEPEPVGLDDDADVA